MIIALIQAVFGFVWAIGASMVTTVQRAVIHWAVWAALSSITWLTLSATLQSPPMLGVLTGVLGVMALQRGICLFIGRPPRDRLYFALMAVILAAYWLTLDPATRHLQTAVNFGVLGWLYLDIARDVYAHARRELRLRWPALLALPVSLGCLAYLLRAFRALLDPESVSAEMAADSALNVRSALIFVTLVITWHSTLIALVVARLVTELRRLSRHDALTSLLNRRAMEEALDSQVQRSRRSDEPFVVMMLDLDHFKRINDQHGHAVGDLALKHVSQLLSHAMREVDTLARFGGEEFVVLMPGATLSHAEPVAERLRELLAASPLLHGATHAPLSVSIGIAQWCGGEDDASRLLSRADAALFQAKVQGRNRVVTARDDAAIESTDLIPDSR
ncbi:MAG: diguanylate cyclase [Steroidobacter sp.]